MSLQSVASLNFVLTEENYATSNNKIIVPMAYYVERKVKVKEATL